MLSYSFIGLLGLLVAFAVCLISILCLAVGCYSGRKNNLKGESLRWAGRLASVVTFVALTLCCAILVWCFMTGDVTIDYVVHNRSETTGMLGWLYKLAGLWAGREGSLLFWAWLITAFNTVVIWRTGKKDRALDSVAILITQLVVAAFVGVLLFSESNMPFTVIDSRYLDASGQLSAMASVLGMNSLLEHWAMAIHPPTLFIGYAGLTIPFAYAIAALVVNDDSADWVRACTPYAVFSWVFLGIGIGLGAVWAYVVLGWGGYWGWDPVENASLLPWLIGVALIHSFTIYRQRGAFKRWSIMCACLAFSFVILGTFITRSGLVQSVHAFEGDPVSLVLFLGLIILSLVAGIVGLVLRRKSFGAAGAGSDDDLESMMSRDAAYYVNNLIMIVFAVLLAYLTISSALPTFLPFGGQALSAGTYNSVARPLGIVYCALIAVCPLLGWRRTDPKAFWKKARIPGICAIVVFAVLMFYFVSYLLPSYNAIVAAGGEGAQGLLEQGPSWYYNGLAVVGFAVASLLFFNALFFTVKSWTAGGTLRARFPRIGGGLCHTAMAIILVGLIGSSMYVTERVAYIPYDEETDSSSESFVIQDFELVYAGNSVTDIGGNNILYQVDFTVYRDGVELGQVHPSVQLDAATQQQKLNASVMGFPLEDLFVVYRGVSLEGELSMDVRVNPLISFVWVGFGLLMVGAVLSLFARRPEVRTVVAEPAQSKKGSSAEQGVEAPGETASSDSDVEEPAHE